MIAAQALVHRATLVTFNPDDLSMSPVSRPWCGRRSSRGRSRYISVGRAAATALAVWPRFIPEEAGGDFRIQTRDPNVCFQLRSGRPVFER